MTAPNLTRRVAIGAVLLAVCALYLAGLGRMGLVSTDEPRYADIARAMAQSGDWVTPRLSGMPWFEKPPLLYWLSGTGFKLGLGPELAPRLPVAILSVLFLIFFWRKVRLLWDERTAAIAAAMLATSAGWMAYSHVGVTDLPLAAMFSVALFSALERRINRAAAALGFAVLAKSLVPLVLFLPVLALDYRRWRDWLRPAPLAVFCVVALPWHILCTLRNGPAFLYTLFIQQQFGRFFSPERQHVQHWWFYIPLLLLLLFPWFSFLPFIARAPRDGSSRVLLAATAFGFVFFSASLNKLPGYLLPLLPSICVLAAAGAARARSLRVPAAVTAALIGTLPLAAALLPTALAESFSRAVHDYHPASPWLLALPLLASLAILLVRRHPFGAAACTAAAALLAFQAAIFPQIDKTASARPLWLSQHPSCIPPFTERALVYGLNYYSGQPLPDCTVVDHGTGTVVR